MSRRCERGRRVLVIDSSSDYLWLHALLDRRIVPPSSPGIPPRSACLRTTRVPQFGLDGRGEDVDRTAFVCAKRIDTCTQAKSRGKLSSFSRGKSRSDSIFSDT